MCSGPLASGHGRASAEASAGAGVGGAILFLRDNFLPREAALLYFNDCLGAVYTPSRSTESRY